MAWDDIARQDHRPGCARYPSDMTDREWAILAPLLPPARSGGRPRTVDLRAVMRGHGCPSVHRVQRVPVADAPQGFSAAVHGAGLLLRLAGQRPVGEPPAGAGHERA